MRKRIFCGIIAAFMMLSSVSVMAGRTKPSLYTEYADDWALGKADEKAKSYWNENKAEEDKAAAEYSTIAAFREAFDARYPGVRNEYIAEFKNSDTYKGYMPGYLFGETEHIVNAQDCVTAVPEEDGSIKICAGESATWGFYLPYNSRSIIIKYTGSGNITLTTEEFSYNPVELCEGSGAEQRIEFGVNSGRASNPQYRTFGSYGVLVEQVEHSGEKMVTIASDQEIYIHELRFEKEITMGPYMVESTAFPRSYIPEFSDNETEQKYEMETMSTVIIHEDANVILVNGGRRYIDNNNIETEPYNFDGSMYLPVSTLAKALGYYCEVIPEKGYALMRSDSHQVVLMGGNCTFAEGLSEPVAAPDNVFIYKEGEILAAVRYFGELAGETVDYKNGLVAIDDKYTVRDIMEDGDFYAYMSEKIEPFAESKLSGKTYYVAPEGVGKDSNTGEYSSPITLLAASQIAVAGDTVVLQEGTYRETLVPANSGTERAPITYRAEEGKKVVISATEEISGGTLTDEEKRVYTFDMSGINNGTGTMGTGKDQIFVNGEMKSEARFPDPTEENVHKDNLSQAWGVRGDIFKVDNDANAVDLTTMMGDCLLGYEDDYWKGGIYVGTFGNSYAVLSGKIESSTDGKLTISNERTKMYWWDSWCKSISNGSNSQWNYGMIIGHENAMSVDYEWVVKNKALKMILPEGIDPEDIKVEAKARQRVIDLTDKKYINIEGVDTFGGGITMNNSEMCMLNGMDMKYISHYTLNADPKQGYLDFPFDFKNAGAPQRGENGIYLGGTEDIIVNSRIDHSAGAAVYCTGTYAYIENNIMNDCGYMGSYVAGICIETVPYEPMGKPRGGLSVYNNTVYNVGRGAVSINKNEFDDVKANPYIISHSSAPLLPMDIAYNDFHDACLMTEDAGTVYAHGRNTVFDKKATDFRRNYIYKTVDERYTNPYEVLLYWDGSANGFDTYDNLVFVTGEKGPRLISSASVPGAEAYSRLWNNHKLGALELDSTKPVADALADEYFSEDRPFFAGAYLGREDYYLNNYNKLKENNYSMQYRAAEATPSDAEVVMDASDGYVSYTANNQYLDFSEVDFGTGSNEMVISYRCDANWTFDELELNIFDSEPSEGQIYKITLPQQEPRQGDQTCSHRFTINPTSGKKNVRLKVVDLYSVRIGGLSVYKRELKEDSAELFSYFTYMSQYTDALPHNSNNVVDKLTKSMLLSNDIPASNPHCSAVHNTLENTILRYANVTITDDSDYFVMAAGSRDQLRKQPVYVYVCEPTDSFNNPVKTGKSPVAKFVVYNQKMSDITPIKVPVTNADGYIKAGTYDIYLEFRKETTAVSETSTILYCGFLSKDKNTSEIGAQVRYQGGLYDSSISTKKDSESSFVAALEDRTTTARFKLTFVLPGDTVGYSDVDVINEECSDIKVAYTVMGKNDTTADVGVRVVSYNSETSEETTVATGTFNTGASSAGEQLVELSQSVAPGNYRVYFDFPDSNDKGQTYHLNWFRFE